MIEESRVAVPDGDRDAGTWGGVVVGDGRGVALTSLPSNGPTAPLVWLNARSGQIEPHGAVDGDLRGGCIDELGRLWLLSTHGLTVLDRTSRDHVGVVKQGLGTYKWTVLPVAEGLVGVSGWSMKTTTLISTGELRVIKQLRFPALDLAVHAADGQTSLLSFHAGTMATLGSEGLRTSGQRDLPTGTAPMLVDSAIHVALGRRRRVDRRIPPTEQWRVKPTRLASLDPNTLQPQRSARPPRRFRRFLGVDSHGRLIAQTATSIRLLAPITYQTLATWTPTDPTSELWSSCHVAPHDMVVVRARQFQVPELTLLTW
jgi:hypothetical protein